VVLRAGTIRDGRFDAWIERAPRGGPGAPEQSRFAPGARDPSRTITIPGTAQSVLTVGSYVTKSQFPGTIGTLSGFSSLGPTRDGRGKPELAAPGEFITSARTGWRADGVRHVALQGTSMAAPHVAGAAALVLQAAPLLAADQVGQVVRRALRTDETVGDGPAGGWGGGKLDAAAAVALARTAAFPAVVTVQVDGGRVGVKTDIATTARLGVRGAETMTGPVASTVHTFDLTGLADGQYHCGVEVTADGWVTVDDAAGRGYEVQVGESAGFGNIAGLNPVIAERLRNEGIATLRAWADSTAERLAGVSGVPVDTVRQQDWRGQADKLAAGGPGRTFTVVTVTSPGDEPVIEYDVTDARTQERATGLDGPALLTFLQERAH
jgi:hypothetical protein